MVYSSRPRLSPALCGAVDTEPGFSEHNLEERRMGLAREAGRDSHSSSPTVRALLRVPLFYSRSTTFTCHVVSAMLKYLASALETWVHISCMNPDVFLQRHPMVPSTAM
ncbi:uncharacterized protein LOC144152298 [Haemaphysalis longicornis]